MTGRAMDANAHLNLLGNITVLDLTNVLSGPLCTYQMALLGARVIKVENPKGGDLARNLGASGDLNKKQMGASFLAQNAGKESICINLKDPQGVELFKRLAAKADVVVENFRPGVMDRLGLGYEVLSELNPALILCSISGFGATGPMRENPAYDQIVQGLSGIMSVTGDPSKDAAPMRAGFPVCDSIGGLTAAFAIVAAIHSRSLTGKGQALDVSMLDSSLVTLGWVVSNYLSADVEPQAIGNENMTAAPSGAFRTGTGMLNIAANKQQQFEALCTIIDRPDLARDPRFAEREARKKHRADLKREIESALELNSAEFWENALNALGVPAGRVLSVPEVLAHQQVEARQLIQSFDTTILEDRPLRVTRAGFRSSAGVPSASTPPPTLGQHTTKVLDELGLSEAEIEALANSGVIQDAPNSSV